MPVANRRAVACAAAVVILVCLAATSATAAIQRSITEQIFGDYAIDRVIDGDYTRDELDAAIDVARAGGAAFDEFRAAVQRKYDHEILGLRESGPVGHADDSAFLPVPVAPGERDHPPLAFIVLSAMAAALVLTAAGSSIYRRARR